MEKKTAGILIAAFVVVCLLLVGGVSYTYFNKEKVSSFLSDKEDVTQVEEHTVVAPPTIDDILQFRNDVREQKRYDSIFMNMPDVALIAILMKKGTDMSNADIAKEYLANRKSYDDVIFGAQIRDTYEHNKPDSLPEKPKNDIANPKLE